MQQKHKQLSLTITLLSAIIISGHAVAATNTNPLYKAPAPVKPPASAPQDNQALSSNILTAIKADTGNILAVVNQIPALITNTLNELIEFKKDVTRQESGDNKPMPQIYTMRSNMSALGQLFQDGIATDPNSSNKDIENTNNILLKQQKDAFAASQSYGGTVLTADSFISKQKKPAPILEKIPNVDDLSYTTAIGLSSLIDNTTKAPDNYINAVSGANFMHFTPLVDPTNISQKQYKDYFKLTYSIQSFNNYVIGKYLLRGASVSKNQSALYGKASSDSYLVSITSQPIGYVLRDILLFQSQNYVLTSKLVELQRETLMAQVMTNALLIAANRQNESALYDKSQQTS